MSVPIQDSAKDELSGGSRFIDERRGNESNQSFPLSGRSGTPIQVSSGQQSPVKPNNENGAASRPRESVSGMSCAGREGANAARHVDCKTITGSTPGDSRTKPGDVAKSSLTEAAVGSGSPRRPVGQFPNGKRDSKLGSFSGDHSDQSFPTIYNGD